ncbi:hypothetical protein NSERUTF1_6936 [Nocardia seriolae]|nr:hypothetical protein NSERUTF1_6936 [Nocardia seriolae]
MPPKRHGSKPIATYDLRDCIRMPRCSCANSHVSQALSSSPRHSFIVHLVNAT